MTRCRCAECGAVLAVELHSTSPKDSYYLVHPCGACLQEAAADAVTACQEQNAELECPLDTNPRAREQEGRD